MKQEKSLKDKMHSLWTSLTDSQQPANNKKKNPGKAPSSIDFSGNFKLKDPKILNVAPTGTPLQPLHQWRIDILQQFSACLAYNEEDIRIRLGISKEAIEADKLARKLSKQTEKMQAIKEKEAHKQAIKDTKEREKQEAIEQERVEKVVKEKERVQRRMSLLATNVPAQLPNAAAKRAQEREQLKQQQQKELEAQQAQELLEQQKLLEKKKKQQDQLMAKRLKRKEQQKQPLSISAQLLAEQQAKSKAIVSQFDDRAADVAGAIALALKYTQHHLYARTMVENLLRTAVKDIATAIQLKEFASTLDVYRDVDTSKIGLLSKDQVFIAQEQELAALEEAIQEDERLQAVQAREIQELHHRVQEDRLLELQKGRELRAIEDAEDKEEKLFKLIFDEAARLEQQTQAQQQEIADKEAAISDLDSLLVSEHKQISAAEHKIDELAAIIAEEAEELRAQREETELLADELQDIQDEVAVKVEEVHRLEELVSITAVEAPTDRPYFFMTKDQVLFSNICRTRYS
jgi:hypothetical protein